MMNREVSYFDPDSLVYLPEILDLNKEADFERYQAILAEDSRVLIHDDIESQVKELLKLQHPAEKLAAEKLDALYREHVAGQPLTHYGLWVYFSWSNSLVHLLDEEDFINVRTNRNRYKITDEEQDLLRSKKVGIIGLSVGQSVASALAMERACGELRLCDFDVLELSNYNRIRTRLTNLGLRKTVSVAREIAEIDPFLKVVCFHEGLTMENIDQFFLEGGKLDICIDECDGVDMKIMCRIKAREYQVPVVMEASDNCTIDVERFDLEPNRSLLHGYIDHLDVEKAATLKTNEEKVPYMLAILAPEFMSSRMLASMFEIQESITTWPQLASSVIYGGGICGNVCRRILLGTFTESGRYQLSVDEYFGNKNAGKKDPAEFVRKTKGSLDSMLNELTPFEENSTSHALKPDIIQIVESGGKAPSGGNLQPWLWHYSAQKGLFQFIDKSQQSPLLDHRYCASLIGLGASAENVVLQGQALGHSLKATYLNPDLGGDANLVARFENAAAEETHPYPELSEFIQARITNRKLGERVSIDSEQLAELQQVVASVPGAELHLIEGDDDLNTIAEIYSDVELARLADAQGHKDFMDEARWTEEEEKERQDGVNVWSLDIDNSDYAGLLACKQRGALELIREWGKGSKLTNLFRKSIDAAGAIGLITMPGSSDQDLFEGGRALQRVWLAATKMNLAFQPQSPSTLLFYRMALDGEGDMDAETQELVKKMKPKFDSVFNLPEGRKEVFMFRLAITDKEATKSHRRDYEKLFTQGE